jgi:hypothetical protein
MKRNMTMELRNLVRRILRESVFDGGLQGVEPGRYVYHTSNPIFRDMISKKGLIPKGRSEAWLTGTKIDGKVIFAVNSDDPSDWWDSTYDDDIYRIDTSGLNNKWYVDPNFDLEDKRIITFERIPLDSIELIRKGEPEGFLNESIEIKNPSDDEYNDIFVDGNKIGYIILSPARKEYYWVDINLPNPLALVDIKIFNEFRGKNYLTETMEWLEGFAKDRGYKSLFLRIDDNSEISSDILFQIYQKYGFRPYKTVDEEEDIFMYKNL